MGNVFLELSPFAFFKLLPFANLHIENFQKEILKTVTSSSLRFGQLKEDGERNT